MSIDGDWEGYYIGPTVGVAPEREQTSEFPVRAHFETKNNRLLGTMLDLQPTKSVTYRDMFEDRREFATAPEIERAETFLAVHPGTRLCINLPPESRLSGRVKGSNVGFFKHYLGVHEIGWDIEGQIQRVVVKNNHRVWYEGTLTEDGSVLEGTWRICRRLGKWGPPAVAGSFRLVRSNSRHALTSE